MRTIKRHVFDNYLQHFRKIHICNDYYMLSVISKTGRSGVVEWDIRNILLYLLSFIFVVVKVVD